MLEVIIPEQEFWNDETHEFFITKPQFLQLEHSLLSLSKWESKWCKPFLGKAQKTNEETIDYVRCMTITQNVKPDVYTTIPANILNDIKKYIDAPMTATWFREEQKGTGVAAQKEIVTAEIIYYWMIAQNIPIECQKWHLNRLLTLIRVCSIKNQPPPQKGNRSKRSALEHRRALNESRRAQFNSKG